VQHGYLLDVRLRVCDRCSHLRQRPRLVHRVHVNLARELAVDVLLPGHGDPLLRLFSEVTQVATDISVDYDAATGTQVTHDLVARNGMTALCVAHDHALGAGDGEA